MDDSSARRMMVDAARWSFGLVFIILGKPFLKRQLVVFVFHEVSDEPRAHARETRTFSRIETFQKQIKWIRETFKIRDLKEDGISPNFGECVISFDDGYVGVKRNALPLLEDAKIPFICFVNIATVSGDVNSSALAMYMAGSERRPVNWRESNPRFYSKAMKFLEESGRRKVEEYQGPYLTSEELDSLSRNPLVTIGDHMFNHWYLDELTMQEFECELEKGQLKLRKLASYRPFFAAPHGVASQSVLRMLQKNSFRKVFSGSQIQRVEGMGVFPRIDLNDEISSRYKFFGAIAISLLRSNLKRIGDRRSLAKE